MGFFLFLLYLAAFFLRPTELFSGLAGYQVMDVLAVFALAGAALGWLGGRRPLLRAPQLYLVLALVLWASSSVLITLGWLRGALAAFGHLGVSLFLFLLAVLNLDSLNRLRTTVALLVVIAVLLAGQGIAALHFGLLRQHFIFSVPSAIPPESESEDDDDLGATVDPEELLGRGPRIRGLGHLNDPNDLAQSLVSLLPLILAFRRSDDRAANLLRVWVPAAFVLYGMHLTRSRGALVSLLALLFLALSSRLGGLLSFAFGSLAGIGALVLFVFGAGVSELDESSAVRIYAWHAGLQMLKASPIWGVGFGNFSEGHEQVAHNAFVHCVAELGLVGYFLWLCVLATTLFDSVVLSGRLDPDDPFDAEVSRWLWATRAGLVAFLVAGFFLSSAYSPMLFLLVGLSTATVELARQHGRPVPSLHLFGWLAGILVLEVATLGLVYLGIRLAS